MRCRFTVYIHVLAYVYNSLFKILSVIHIPVRMDGGSEQTAQEGNANAQPPQQSAVQRIIVST